MHRASILCNTKAVLESGDFFEGGMHMTGQGWDLVK